MTYIVTYIASALCEMLSLSNLPLQLYVLLVIGSPIHFIERESGRKTSYLHALAFCVLKYDLKHRSVHSVITPQVNEVL